MGLINLERKSFSNVNQQCSRLLHVNKKKNDGTIQLHFETTKKITGGGLNKTTKIVNNILFLASMVIKQNVMNKRNSENDHLAVVSIKLCIQLL